MTINTLFYNINERKVEDFTKLGISDMQRRIARTPVEPYKTFMDDPLRILRTVRFSQRYDLEMAKDIEEAAKSQEV